MGHIWLVGMMGTGKTTISALVAERLGRPVADTDALVMGATGRTIPELFEESEETFRAFEADVIVSFAGAPDSVVATGGGVVLDDRNVAVMRELGTVVLLTATVDDVAMRLGETDGDRPLLTDASAWMRIDRERRTRYFDVADAVVDTSGKSIGDVAEEVLQCVNT